jgi:hypothetical protein
LTMVSSDDVSHSVVIGQQCWPYRLVNRLILFQSLNRRVLNAVGAY